MENNRNFFNYVTHDKKMLKTSNFGIYLFLGCLFDQNLIIGLIYTEKFANLALVWVLMAFYCFFCLKTMENNRKTMKPIEIVKIFLVDVKPL